MFGHKVHSLGEYYIVIPKILKVWPSYIAGKRSFIAFPIYQMSGPTLFLVAHVYLIFYQYISRIYLKCTCCGGVTHPPRSLRPWSHCNSCDVMSQLIPSISYCRIPSPSQGQHFCQHHPYCSLICSISA